MRQSSTWKNPRIMFPGRQGREWTLLTSLEIMVKKQGRGGWEGWFDAYIKYQRKEYHFNCQMAYWYILTCFEYWALKLLKDKASKCVRNTGNDWVLGWHRSEIILLGELPGNINGKYYSWGGNSQVQISTSHIQLHTLNIVIPTALLEALRGGGVSVINENH